ncbi:MAG: M14 family metallopeptidase [Pseudomonadota bacterium]|nr:M14 family metallopeptidase [Pseudomonadota bacterium]
MKFFSQNYEEARVKFREAAAAEGCLLSAESHPALLAGDGSALTVDVARLGPPRASSVLVLCSGTHGVEGFGGSGGQTALLRDGILRHRPPSCAVVLIHAINPYGFAYLRRVNEDNVDCNRNFIDFRSPLPANPDYDVVHAALIPPEWNGPARLDADTQLQTHIKAFGFSRFQQAVSMGQYTHPDGLFYGGTSPVWSNRVFRRIVHDHLSQAEDIAWIDLHTGLGTYGIGEAIFIGPKEAPEYHRAIAWYGSVTSTDAGTAVAAPLRGALIHAIEDECTAARVTGIGLEFGTRDVQVVLEALRAEQWWHLYGQADERLGNDLKQRLRDAFYCDEARWHSMVVTRTLEITELAIRGLQRTSVTPGQSRTR